MVPNQSDEPVSDQTDIVNLRNAGADVVDQDVVVDGNLITSRSPDDMPAFCDTIVAKFASNSIQEEVMS